MRSRAATLAPWRTRIVGSGDEDPTQLIADPGDWRLHPRAQRDALRLEEAAMWDLVTELGGSRITVRSGCPPRWAAFPSSSGWRCLDVLAGDDQTPPGACYALHRRYLVPVAAIELDEHVWEWVRRHFPRVTAEPELRDRGGIYPVVEREDRLVLLAGFTTFTALREAGAAWATVYVLEATDEGDLLELAGALALGGP